MHIALTPTTNAETTLPIQIPVNGVLILSLDDLPLGEITSGYKIQILVDGIWEDYVAWPIDEPTMTLYGSTNIELTVRASKEITPTPVGFRISPNLVV